MMSELGFPGVLFWLALLFGGLYFLAINLEPGILSRLCYYMRNYQ